MKQDDLIGRSFCFEYSSETYLIEVLDGEKLRWTQERGPKVGSGDTENYVFSEIAGETVLLTWIEADGLGLSNVLNFASGTVTTHANVGRDVFVNPGKLLTG